MYISRYIYAFICMSYYLSLYMYMCISINTYIRRINAVTSDKKGFVSTLPYVITEFLPNVPWAGKFNTIPAAAAHHIREGRWLHTPEYLDSYVRFWFTVHGKHATTYSFWPADSTYARSIVTGNIDILEELLPSLIEFHLKVKKTNYDPIMKLYFNTDNRDGMELSIGGSSGSRNYRPTLNSYRYGDSIAISRIAKLLGRIEMAKLYKQEAAALKISIEKQLWDPKDNFFKVLTYVTEKGRKRGDKNELVRVRELHGYTPWYFNLPSKSKRQGSRNGGLPNGGQDVNNDDHVIKSDKHEDLYTRSTGLDNQNKFNISKLSAFTQLTDKSGFSAAYGLTTAEQRDPNFIIDYKVSACILL